MFCTYILRKIFTPNLKSGIIEKKFGDDIVKIFDTGIIVGRFQHIHSGHEKIIDIGRTLCNKLLIFVGSYGVETSLKNPYDYEYRKKLITKIYRNDIEKGSVIIRPLKDLSNKNELSPKWGEYVISNATEILGKRPDCIIYGKDKDIFKCFDKETVKSITEILVDRDAFNISATKMRKLLLEDKKDEWKKYANSAIHDEYLNLKNILANIQKN